MDVRRPALTFLAIALIGGACANTPGPSDGAQPTTTDASAGTEPTGPLTAELIGPWQASPIVLDDPHIAILSDACAAAARATLGTAAGELPTAVVDARGEGLVIAIMADDLDAIECLAHFDRAGSQATVDSVDLLSATTLVPAADAGMTVASMVTEADRPSGRTVAFGRIGTTAASTRIGINGAAVVNGTDAEGWWAAWWQGAVLPTSLSALDAQGTVIGSATPPTSELEVRVKTATWTLDPKKPKPGPTATTLTALVTETACASGKSPDGRVEDPAIEVADTAITITMMIRRLPGGQDCQGNTPFPVTIKLPEPLGNRQLFDGGSTPPGAVSMPTR